MNSDVRFVFTFTGSDADHSLIDFYDVSQALIGFQRSLALTTHLVLNDEIITQAPSLKNASIFAIPPEAGSWKITAIVSMAGAAVFHLGTADKATPLGHMVYSLYDYVVSESLGVHVDYEKSLGQLYEDAKKKKIDVPEIKQSQADSLIEKCSTAIREMHRPIYMTGTAKTGSIYGIVAGKKQPLHTQLNAETYDFIHQTRTAEETEAIIGRISSYNSNTFKGRVFVSEVGRPIAFELAEHARTQRVIRLVTSSLRANALKEYENKASTVHCVALRKTSRTGYLKSFLILDVMEPSK